MVRDIDPGPAASLPSSLTVVDGLLYFTAVQFGTGRQVWRSDGTEAGTVRLTGELPGVGELATFAKKDNYVYFAAPHPAAGFELCRTDGTPAGTVLFKDINEEELPTWSRCDRTDERLHVTPRPLPSLHPSAFRIHPSFARLPSAACTTWR